MIDRIIQYSIRHKLIIILFSLAIVASGIYSLFNIPIGAVPDITNNQVQIITTSRNLATEDVEKFLTYPVELEMANLPEVKEIRSVSKFGLSVVTVVFNDRIGTYLPRQLIAEKIKSAQEKIPSGFGIPFMGPISTGLGEIYQYVIEVDSTSRDKYTLTDIRTIQDWLVKRQLSGIPGVVEVNTWGGYLKQYEVAVNPEKLKSLNLSLSETFVALEKNNSVAGGGYIEKTNQTYFIRGEGLIGSKEDIENIVIESRNGIPIYVRDIATVRFGHATRFGAITGNGEGEKVLGQVMMLKDANSKEVIEAVKERVEQIQTTLPKGISINGFLERSELIGKTTATIAENLILGCLIVIFVVILLLGNFRSGMVVASVIPLCLLFALTLMYIFGVDANLMSLGAIDFGIIIDGAVIIVEFIAFKITSEREKIISLPKSDKQNLIDSITNSGASKMMHSAIFGQLIIIIVFIPILSLVGVEGKMFKPMALVFCFALLGAIVLCFTYVPVMASLFIKPTDPNKNTISSRLIKFLEDKYKPTMAWALKRKRLVLGLGFSMLLLSIFLFSRMGGEFVPTLDEGDFVIQPVFKTGTSLSKTVENITKIEKILKEFPEVEQVVSRIGAAEVPTDPMSMEESDVIIKLKPKKEWKTANDKDELADQFKKALSILPGIDYEFTQPIEMRFNELITGVRADLAIKIFGENLDVLYKKAVEIEKAIQNIDGASDIVVEKTVGLPQMSVTYNRQKIAKYGLNVQDLNDIISMGFAGKTAGTIFEGEKQFDLVIRYDKDHHKDIQDIEWASVKLPNGSHMPLKEFATIEYNRGPAKISRDNTKRRIVVGVNVRNRDLESVVNDVQKTIESKITLPPGYIVEYGGQFENLRTAKNRLMIAVPVALILIFILLYFAFDSIKDALIIYSAIPMAAVGGIFLLYLRGMPFSISAGVGFIALFGIAVLNGIVLIEEFKELKSHGIRDIHDRILIGTKNRLRPVLLTASAAALGFLPMAISTSAGAEVQKPLATVVIGGLISATALTLIVLPVLYSLFDRKGKRSGFKFANKGLILTLFLILPIISQAQQPINLDQAIDIALGNNRSLKASKKRLLQSEELISGYLDINKTNFYYSKDQNNLGPNQEPLNVWGINQSLEFPTVYSKKRKILKTKSEIVLQQYRLDSLNLRKNVSDVYFEMIYWQQVYHSYSELDSLYKHFAYGAKRKFEEGESNYLEQLTAEAKSQEILIQLKQARENISKFNLKLKELLQSDSIFVISENVLPKLQVKFLETESHPLINFYKDRIDLANHELSLNRQGFLPDLNFSVFQGGNNGLGSDKFSGFEVGISLPIFFWSQKSKINAASIEADARNYEADNYAIALETKYDALLMDIKQKEKELAYFENKGEDLSKKLRLHAQEAFRNGEIDYLQYTMLLENSTSIKLNYLKALLGYNLTVLEANYITY